ncbi:MAG: Zinc/manganese transport system permease protein [Acidimicrobiales bacterium]|nr:Zinc/manganese transport system permease protein [Acidimicrobiales bacterium]
MIRLVLAADPRFTWDLVRDLRQLFEFPFMVNAFRAGTIVAVVAGCVGWFMVLRRQTFAGHTLAVVGFPGAAGAVLIGVSAQAGFFAFCIAAALVIAALPQSGQRSFSEESAVIGTVQSFGLACGFLFVSLYRGNLNGINALLFGSFVGITSAQVAVLAALGAVAISLLAVMARPLLFASIDPDVAAARGVPVRVLAAGFLVLLGAAAAATSQITGSLLVFALLVLPAATAQRITDRPGLGVALSVGIALAVTWAGLAFAYYSTYPIGFYVTTIAFGLYLATNLGAVARWAGWRPRRLAPS